MSPTPANSGRAVSGVRKPRGKLTVNGQVMPPPDTVEVASAAHFVADTFRAEWAVAALPTGMGPSYWGSTLSALVEVSVGYADATSEQVANWTSLILGQVDDVEYDPIARTIALAGRDLSGRLVDTVTAEKWPNKKASDIAAALAARHGLTAVVTPTTTRAGTYYEIDDSVLTSEETEWDLLKALAEHEGFDVWVKGTTLFFQPPPSDTDTAAYVLLWDDPGDGTSPQFNGTRLRLKRSLTVAKDIDVLVRSRNQAMGRTFETTYRVRQKKGPHQGTPQRYSFVVPNLTQEKTLQYAKAKAEEITRFERILEADLPGDEILSTRTMVKLAGTGTDWDQLYYPEAITRRLSVKGGFTMQLRAKNHSPQDTVIV